VRTHSSEKHTSLLHKIVNEEAESFIAHATEIFLDRNIIFNIFYIFLIYVQKQFLKYTLILLSFCDFRQICISL